MRTSLYSLRVACRPERFRVVQYPAKSVCPGWSACCVLTAQGSQAGSVGGLCNGLWAGTAVLLANARSLPVRTPGRVPREEAAYGLVRPHPEILGGVSTPTPNSTSQRRYPAFIASSWNIFTVSSENSRRSLPTRHSF